MDKLQSDVLKFMDGANQEWEKQPKISRPNNSLRSDHQIVDGLLCELKSVLKVFKALCTTDRRYLRTCLILEEAIETIEALVSSDMVGAIDGICDLIYVAIGGANELGYRLKPFWDIVQEDNMNKLEAGGLDKNGKFCKPQRWNSQITKKIQDEMSRQIAEAMERESEILRHVPE